MQRQITKILKLAVQINESGVYDVSLHYTSAVLMIAVYRRFDKIYEEAILLKTQSQAGKLKCMEAKLTEFAGEIQ